MGSWPAVSPGVLCALGDATTRMRTESARSLSRRRSQVTDAEVLALLQEMQAQTAQSLAADGVPEATISAQFEIDVRYHGQAFEVPMQVSLEGFAEGGLDRLATAFDAEHRRLFTFTTEAEHEFVNLRVIALGGIADIPAQPIEQGGGDPRAAWVRDHDIWILARTTLREHTRKRPMASRPFWLRFRRRLLHRA